MAEWKMLSAGIYRTQDTPLPHRHHNTSTAAQARLSCTIPGIVVFTFEGHKEMKEILVLMDNGTGGGNYNEI